MPATKKARTRKSRKLTIKQEKATRPTMEAIKAMTPAQRKRLADRLVPGLAGQARQIWIDTGKTFNEQLVEYRIDQLIKAGWNPKYVREAAQRKPLAFAHSHILPEAGAPEQQETARDRKRRERAERQIARAKARTEKERLKQEIAKTKQANTKETNMKTKTTKKQAATRTKRAKEQPATKTIAVNVITPADIAAEAGTTPKRVRIYLRANNVAKTNGHYGWNKRDARKLITAIRKEVTA